MSLANILQIICGKLHQNRFIRLGCRDDTHTQTHTHTHTHTDTLGFDRNIFSQNLTEYKNKINRRMKEGKSMIKEERDFESPGR